MDYSGEIISVAVAQAAPANSYIFPEYTYNKKCILTFFFNVLNYM